MEIKFARKVEHQQTERRKQKKNNSIGKIFLKMKMVVKMLRLLSETFFAIVQSTARVKTSIRRSSSVKGEQVFQTVCLKSRVLNVFRIFDNGFKRRRKPNF